jgi:hypothetical protein
MDSKQRAILNEIMPGIVFVENRMGQLVAVEELSKHLSGKVSKKDIAWAIDYLNENCVIYTPKEGYLVRF